MILNKITHGFVIQRYDTEKKEFIDQEFVAGDCEWENPETEEIVDDPDNEHLPFHMEQPKKS